jgi:hypothetical protein
LALLLSAPETVLLAMKVTPAGRSLAVSSVAGSVGTGVAMATPAAARRMARAVSCMVLDGLSG